MMDVAVDIFQAWVDDHPDQVRRRNLTRLSTSDLDKAWWYDPIYPFAVTIPADADRRHPMRSRDADLARLALQTADQRVYLVVVRVAGDRDTVLLAIPAEAGDDARRYIPIVGDDAPPEPASLDERPPPAAG